MNGVNFFSWIRDGVRQSVLLGVSDAVEQLGSPPTNEEVHPSAAGLLGPVMKSSTISPAAPIRNKSSAGGGTRRRLGRSLKDMNAPKPE